MEAMVEEAEKVDGPLLAAFQAAGIPVDRVTALALLMLASRGYHGPLALHSFVETGKTFFDESLTKVKCDG